MRKKKQLCILLLSLLGFSSSSFAQNERTQSIGLSFQKIDVGRGLQLNYNRQLSNRLSQYGVFPFNAIGYI